MTPINDTADLSAALATGSETLGALCYWTQLDQVRIRRAALRAGFASIGLEEALGRDPKPEASLRQAAIAAGRRGRDGGIRIELKSKDPMGPGARCTYSVLLRRDLPDGRRRYMEEAVASIDRTDLVPLLSTATISGVEQSDERDEALLRLREVYLDLLEYAHTPEVSGAMVGALTLLGGITLRTGVYFVPARFVDRARALKAFFAQETDVDIAIWDIARGDANAAEARNSAKQALQDRVRSLHADVAEYMAGLPTDTEPTKRGVRAHAEHFRALEAQVALYTEILGDARDGLLREISTARQATIGAYLERA